MTVFAKTSTKGHWPLDDLWPTSVEVLCVTLPKDHCVQVPWKYIKVCGYSDFFCKKNLNQRSLTPRWPLTPHLLRSHVWLYPRIIVFKSHENTSKYVDTVNLFAKTRTKGHWPLDDLWPTSAEVTCVTLPKNHCVQVPWEYINVCGYSDQFCQNYHIHTHTTYILHTYYVQNQWSLSLFLNYVQARQKPILQKPVDSDFAFWAKSHLEMQAKLAISCSNFGHFHVTVWMDYTT